MKSEGYKKQDSFSSFFNVEITDTERVAMINQPEELIRLVRIKLATQITEVLMKPIIPMLTKYSEKMQELINDQREGK